MKSLSDHFHESYRAVYCGAVYFARKHQVLTFELANKVTRMTIQKNAHQQYFPVVLFIMSDKVVSITSEYVDKILV